jgi:competence protein ComEC
MCALAAVVGGILIAPHAGVPSVLMLGLGFVLLLGALLVRRRGRVVLAVVAFGLLGVAVTARALDGQRHWALAGSTVRRAEVTVPAELVDDPATSRYSTSVLLRVRVAGKHRIVLAIANGSDSARLAVLEAGDRVTVTGRLAPLRPTGFDERARWRHAVARLTALHVNGIRPPARLFAVANTVRGVVLRGTASLPPTTRALVAGFLLGDTGDIPRDVVASYRDAGLSHLLAVSGENVAFALALVSPLLHRLRLGARTAVALGVIVLFAAMTRFEPSVLRASVMAAIALLAVLAGRPAARLRVLVLAMIALLLADPFLLHSVGFLLSCGASAGIALFEPWLARRIPGPQLVREPLAVSLSAQLGVMPVLVMAFGAFPVVTPLTNLAAAPAAELLGVYGLVVSGASGIVPALGPFLQQPTALLVTWVTLVARVGAAVPLQLDARALLGCFSVCAAIASVACARARRAVSVAATR